MIFIEGHIYHIYNQGNNKGQVFFTHANYLFFLQKIRKYILPYADILAWCLMPNHFHLMIHINAIDGVIPAIDGVTQSHPVNYLHKKQTLNSSIGIMLRSYTRAINKQENRSGSLFREETKAICLNEIGGVAPNWFKSAGITYFTVSLPEKAYPQVCFNYIHQNPVNAGLVKRPGEWEFSSFADIVGLRNGTLVNHRRIHEFGIFIDIVNPAHPAHAQHDS